MSVCFKFLTGWVVVITCFPRVGLAIMSDFEMEGC